MCVNILMSYNPYSHDSEPASASSIVIREVETMHEQDVYHHDNENENSPFYDEKDACSLSEGTRGVDDMSEGSQRSSRGRSSRGHGLRDKDWYHTVVEASMDNLKNTKYVDIEKAMADVQAALTLPMHMRPDINLCGTLELGMMNIVNYQEGLRLKRMNQAIDHIVSKGKELRKEERKKRNMKNENNDEAMGNGEVDLLDLEANFVFPLTYEEQFPDSPPPVYDESQPREEDGIIPPVERTKKNHDLLIEAWAGLGMPSDATDQQMDEFMMAHSQASYDRMIEESQKQRTEEEEGSIPCSAPSAGMFSLVPSSVQTPEIFLENQEVMSDRTPSPPTRKKQTRKKGDPYDEKNPHPGPYRETQLPTIRAFYPKIKKELEDIDEMHPWISEDDDANLMNNLSLHPDNVARASQGQGIQLRPMVDDEPSEEYSASLSSGMEIYKSAPPGSEIEPAERDPLEVMIDEDYKHEMDPAKGGIYDDPLEFEAFHHVEEDEKIHHVESPGDSREGTNKWDVLAAEGQEPRVDVQYWDSIIKGRQKFEPLDEFENSDQYHDFFYHLLFRANQGLVDILPQEYGDGGVRWRVVEEEDGDENCIDLLEALAGDHQACTTPRTLIIDDPLARRAFDDPLTPKNSEESLLNSLTCIGVESFHHSGSNSNTRSRNPLITLMTPREVAGDPKDEIENDENTQNTGMQQPSGSQYYDENSQNTMIQQHSGSHPHHHDDDGKEGDDEDGESDTDNRDFVRGSMIRSQNATHRTGHFYGHSGDHTQSIAAASDHLTRGQEASENVRKIVKDSNQRIRTSTAGNTKCRESRTTFSSRDSTEPMTSSNNNSNGNSNPDPSGHRSNGMSKGRKKTDASQTQSLSSRMAAALAAKDA